MHIYINIGTPWIAAFHCTAPEVDNVTKCAHDMIATIYILRYDNGMCSL